MFGLLALVRNRAIAFLDERGSAFARDSRGVAFALFAMAAVPIIASIGVATDVARGYLIKNRLTEAVDAASLAAGRQSDPALRQADAERFFWANFGHDYLGTTIIDGPTAVSDPDNGTVTVTAIAQVPTTFMGAVGIRTVDVGAKAVVTRQMGGMELMLVMDNTGSMAQNGKMDAMKSAAKELLKILYAEANELEDVYVGLVPYVTVVNVGSSHTNWLTADFDIGDYADDPDDWTGCVVARDAPHDTSDDPPSVEAIPAYYWPKDSWLYALFNPHNNNYWPPVVTDDGYSGNGQRGPNKGCVMPMTPLSPYRDRIEDQIDLMEPRAYGGTMINVGLVWGWRALSPRWRGLWGGDTPADLPVDYDDGRIRKVIILLTDGDNQFSNTTDMTAYRKRSEGVLGTTSKSAAEEELDARTAQTCSAVKAAGIELYTITFQQDDEDIQALMNSCASDAKEDHYFDSPDNDTLKENFKLIAGKLSKLRLSE